jgi:hypothetical protein
MSYNFSGTNHTFTNNTKVGIGEVAPSAKLRPLPKLLKYQDKSLRQEI